MIREVAASQPGEQVYQSERGQLIIRTYQAPIILFIEQGFLEKGFVPYIERAQNVLMQQGGKPSIFVDAETLNGYEPEIQSSATQWVKANKHRIAAQHMLVSSLITRMGLSVASLALGGVIKGYMSRPEFEAALRRAVDDASTRGM